MARETEEENSGDKKEEEVGVPPAAMDTEIQKKKNTERKKIL